MARILPRRRPLGRARYSPTRLIDQNIRIERPPMKTIDQSILDTLAEYDSATVQNAGILVRGYVHANDDYTDPSVREYISPGDKPAVGYALTSTWTPLSGEQSDGYLRTDYFDSIAKANVTVIVVQQDIDKPANRGAIIGDGMAFQMKALGAVGALV